MTLQRMASCCWFWLMLLLLVLLTTTTNARRRELPEDFDVKEAVKKTQDLFRKSREQDNIKEANRRARAEQGFPPEDDADDNAADPNEGTGGYHSFNRTVDPREWIVTATTPVVDDATKETDHKRGSKLATKQPPYVHWICYRGHEDAVSTGISGKVPCCQRIFRAMLADPPSLCWKTDLKACGHNPNAVDQQRMELNLFPEEEKQKLKEIAAESKTEFMQFCTHNLAPFPNADLPTPYRYYHTTQGEDEDGQEIDIVDTKRLLRHVPARWSLVQAPGVLRHKPTHEWRQLILDAHDVSVYLKSALLSPLQIARPMKLPIRDGDDTPPTVQAPPHKLPLEVYSRIDHHDDDEDEWRSLHTTVKVGGFSCPIEDGCSGRFVLLLFLPDEIKVVRTKSKKKDKKQTSEYRLSACASTMGDPCEVHVTANTYLPQKASVWGQPTIVALQMDVPNVKRRREYQFTTTLTVEDEESLVVSSPVLYRGEIVYDDQVVNAWNGNVKPPLKVLLTDLEERERLQDIWKMEL